MTHPGTAFKTDPVRAGVAVRMGLNLVALFARLSSPFIPFTAAVIAEAVGEPADAGWPSSELLNVLEPGRAVRAPEVLFRKVEDTQVAEWRERFGGPES